MAIWLVAERFEISLGHLRALVQSLEDAKPLVPVGTTSTRVLESLYWIGFRDFVRSTTSSSSNTSNTSTRQRSDAVGIPGDPLLTAAAGIGGSTHELGCEGGWLELGQWEPYDLLQAWLSEGFDVTSKGLPCTAATSYRFLLDRLEQQSQSREQDEPPSLRGATSLCIVPGYRFAVADALITNFHQPDSTLLLLVAAFLEQRSSVEPQLSPTGSGGVALKQLYAHALRNNYRFLSYGDACLLL